MEWVLECSKFNFIAEKETHCIGAQENMMLYVDMYILHIIIHYSSTCQKFNWFKPAKKRAKGESRLMRYENQTIYKGIDGSTPFFKSSPFGHESLDSAPARLLPRPSSRSYTAEPFERAKPYLVDKKTIENIRTQELQSMCLVHLYHFVSMAYGIVNLSNSLHLQTTSMTC